MNPKATVIQDADPERDVIAMTEVPYGQKRFPEHKQRLALRFAAMRHHRDDTRTAIFRRADAVRTMMRNGTV